MRYRNDKFFTPHANTLIVQGDKFFNPSDGTLKNIRLRNVAPAVTPLRVRDFAGTVLRLNPYFDAR
jgi:hypothetical protein